MLTSRARSRAALLGWAALIGLATVVVLGSGHGTLAPPPLLHPARWARWASARPPVDAGFAVVRLLAVAAAAELAVTTVAGAAARVTGSTRMTAAVDRLTAAPLRALLSGAFGLGLATTALAGGVASAAPAPPAVETMVPVDAPATETMTPVDTWLVHRGESFWSIAAHVETDAHERVATNREVADYWRRLMAANRDKYRDADLIYPGQEFELPPG